ncbi:MAG: nitrilotriacetate monooxygenase, partial [Hyphomicrobiaceae bacterium]
VMPIIGRTEAEAKAQLDRLQSWVSPTTALRMVSLRLGYDISKHDLDGPVPELPANANSQSFARTLFAKARRENMTLRDLYNIAAAARGHWVIWGTPTRIADTLQEWFEGGLADGFMIQPAYFPGAFDDFVDLVVPELQRRGLFRRDYAGATLRDHLRSGR